MNNGRSKLALILGSGFSAAVGGETTETVNKKFLWPPDNSILTSKGYPELDEFISEKLEKFWVDIFGFDPENGAYCPSFEDHFTVLDMSANTGHHLGANYSPKQLRAIRRFSIHRVFDILNKPVTSYKLNIGKELFENLKEKYDLTIVTLNWDRLAEEALQNGYDYGIAFENMRANHTNVHLLKMHGSTTWLYCDNCRKLFAELPNPKVTVEELTFIEPDDFRALKGKGYIAKAEEAVKDSENSKCACGSILGSRPATFSFRKNFSLSFFQTLWEIARKELASADKWLIIGYSLPDADYEFKYLLKSAQFAKSQGQLQIFKVPVILHEGNNCVRFCADKKRCLAFFGPNKTSVYGEGLCDTIVEQLDDILAN